MLATRLIAGMISGIVLSAVFATCATLLNFGETFIEPLRIDPARPAPITLRMPRLTMQVPDPVTGGVRLKKVAKTIARGRIVRDQRLAVLVRNYERERRPPRPTQLGAEWFVCFLLCLTMTASLRQSPSRRGILLRSQVGLLGTSFALLAGAKAFLIFTPYQAFVIPAAVVPLWTSFYLDRRTGLEIGLALGLVHASLVSYDPLSLAVFLSASATAPLLLTHKKDSLMLLLAGVVAGLAAGLTYVAVKEMQDGFSLSGELGNIWRSGLAATVTGGVLAGAVAYVFQWPVGRMLDLPTRGQLLDLTDLEHPLLKKMAAQAPGSWEHSRGLANIAEAAAAAVGADASLTRVGAYYHDVGKIVQPEYFVENLEEGQENPHQSLEPNVSADAIMAHVVEGVRLLRRYGIPEPVVEFAYSHHGTSLIEYFWHEYKERPSAPGLSEDAFRYPGIRPRSRETAIVMLADAIEAAARTIERPSRERFEELVQRTVFGKLGQGQLDECGLTVKELKTIAKQFTDTLCRVYHGRIRYPWQEAKERNGEPTPTGDTDTEGKPKKDEGKARQKERPGGEQQADEQRESNARNAD
jgi:putative nucleotidyltransferase with HDIG domain